MTIAGDCRIERRSAGPRPFECGVMRQAFAIRQRQLYTAPLPEPERIHYRTARRVNA